MHNSRISIETFYIIYAIFQDVNGDKFIIKIFSTNKYYCMAVNLLFPQNKREYTSFSTLFMKKITYMFKITKIRIYLIRFRKFNI